MNNITQISDEQLIITLMQAQTMEQAKPILGEMDRRVNQKREMK